MGSGVIIPSLLPNSTAGAYEKKEIQEDVGGGKADDNKGANDGILPDGVETSLQKVRRLLEIFWIEKF